MRHPIVHSFPAEYLKQFKEEPKKVPGSCKGCALKDGFGCGYPQKSIVSFQGGCQPKDRADGADVIFTKK